MLVLPLLGVAAGTAVSARADAPRLSLQVTAGYSGISAYAGEWIPVILDLRAGSGDIDAQAEVTATGGQQNGSAFGSSGVTSCVSLPNGGTACTSSGGGGGFIGPFGQSSGSAVGLTYRLPVVMAAGTSKRYVLYTIASGTGIHVRLAQGNDTLAQQDATVALSSGTTAARIAVISDTPGALPTLGGLHLFNGMRVDSVVLAPSALPSAGIALSAFDAVVIDGASTSALTTDQRQALDDMVHGGGALVIAGGAHTQAAIAGLPQDLLPADVGAVATLPGLPHYAALAGATTPVGRLDAVTLAPARGGHVTVREGDLPLVVEADRGAGRVVALAIDPGVEPLASWSGTAALLRQVVTRAQRAAPALAVAAGPQGLAVRPVPLGRAGELTQAVTTLPALDLPSAALVGLLLIGYLLIVGPINYLVLRRLRHRDLMWVTVPVLAVLGTVTAYATGLGTRGSAVVLSEVRVVTVAPGDARALVETYAAAFSPRGGTATVHLGAATNVGGMAGLVSGNGTVVAVPGQPATVQLEGTSTASLHGFSAAGYQAIDGRVSADVHLRGGRLQGTVTNHLGVTLTDIKVVSEGSIAQLGAVPDGGTVAVDVSATGQVSSGPGNSQNFPVPAGYGSGSTTAERDAARRQYVLTALTSGFLGEGASALGAQALIVGVADRPVVTSGAAGSDVNGHILDAVVIPVSDLSAAATTVPIGEIVDQVANAGDPAKSDSVVQYHIGSAPAALHMDAASVTQVSGCLGGAPPGAVCVGGKGPGVISAPGSSPPPATSYELFNVASGGWDALPLGTDGTAYLGNAAPYVDSDGLLLLRVSAGSGAMPVLHISAATAP